MNRKNARFVYPLLAALIAGVDHGWSLGYYGGCSMGIGELISEQLQKLDWVLPKKRLYCSYGALTFGGLAGMIVALPALAIALANGLTGAGYLGVLSVGGLLCFVFGGLLFREY